MSVRDKLKSCKCPSRTTIATIIGTILFCVAAGLVYAHSCVPGNDSNDTARGTIGFNSFDNETCDTQYSVAVAFVTAACMKLISLLAVEGSVRIFGTDWVKLRIAGILRAVVGSLLFWYYFFSGRGTMGELVALILVFWDALEGLALSLEGLALLCVPKAGFFQLFMSPAVKKDVKDTVEEIRRNSQASAAAASAEEGRNGGRRSSRTNDAVRQAMYALNALIKLAEEQEPYAKGDAASSTMTEKVLNQAKIAFDALASIGKPEENRVVEVGVSDGGRDWSEHSVGNQVAEVPSRFVCDAEVHIQPDDGSTVDDRSVKKASEEAPGGDRVEQQDAEERAVEPPGPSASRVDSGESVSVDAESGLVQYKKEEGSIPFVDISEDETEDLDRCEDTSKDADESADT